MSIAYLAIGSNIGERESNCEEAVLRLDSLGEIKVIERSAFYETSPVGGPPQKDYFNGVIKVETTLSPRDCLEAVKNIEKEMGREPSGERNSPRVIDLDILFYDDLEMKTDELTIPHVRMHERHFVLKGLAEIAPNIVHPVLGKTVKELYTRNINK
jgi:dihydroneopterin aldolase/2-amino-4-hydroxy-6-hydroxymethyldihydropteridine diphosphokinase